MLRLILLIGVPALIIALLIFAAQGNRTPPPTFVYFNGTYLMVDNARSLEYNGKTYGAGSYIIPAQNNSLIYVKINGRPIVYKISYAYKVIYYDGVRGVAKVYVQNLGNVTLKFFGVVVQSSGEAELPAGLVQVEPPDLRIDVAPERCTPQSCTAWLHITVEAPYAGRFQVVAGGQPVAVEVNRTGFAKVEAPYGYKVPVELKPWYYKLVEVAPGVNATLRPEGVACSAESCVHLVKLRLWAEVPTDFNVFYGGNMYYASIKSNNGTAELQLQLPPGTSCVSVVPPAKDVCIDLPDRPPRLIAESVQWYYYSYSSIVAVVTAYNPGFYKYVSDVACINCGLPGQEELTAVLQTYYGVVPLGKTVTLPPMSRAQIAIRAGAAGGTLILSNGTKIDLKPPPMPSVKCKYTIEERPGSGGLQPFPSWTIVKHAYVVINFSAPNIYYQNFVRAYAGNYSMPVTCTGQVCTAVVPVEAVLVDKSRPTALLGWRYVGNRTDVAVPAAAFITSPWCTIKIR